MSTPAQKARLREIAVLRGCLLTSTVALAVILVVLLLGWLSVDREVVVERLEWERSVDLQERVIDKGWVRLDQPLPQGAREVGREVRVVGTKEVVVGQRTVQELEPVDEVIGTTRRYKGLQDGPDGELEPVWVDEPETRRRMEPVDRIEAITETVDDQAEVILWEAERWRTVSTHRASGSTGPSWPKVDLARGQRLGNRSEHYNAVLKTEDDEIFSVSLDPERAETFQPGSTHRIRRTLLGTIVELDDQPYSQAP